MSANQLWLNESPLLIPATGRLNLPLAVPNAPLASGFLVGCSLSTGFIGGNINFDLGALTVYSKDADFLGQIFESNGTDALLRFYSNARGTLKGTARCDTDVLTFDTVLTAGWNLLTVTKGQDGSFNLHTAPASTLSVPTFRKAQEHLDIRLDNKTPISVKRGGTFQVPVTIYQDGGISGDIILRTNVSGISVEPRLISLPGNVGMLSNAGIQEKRTAFRRALGPNSVGAQALKTMLTFKVDAYATAEKGSIYISATKDGGVVGEANLPNVEVLVPQLSADVNAWAASQQSATTWSFNLYPQNYRGDVKVSLQGLPANLSVADQTVTFTNGEPLKVTLPLNVSSAVPIGNWPVTIELTQLADGYVIRKPTLLTVMPKPMELLEVMSSMVADANGNIWYTSRSGLVRQRQDGTYDAFTDPTFRCGDLLFGDDNGIWETSQPLVRFDVLSGSAQLFQDPRGHTGCAGGRFFIDSAGRGWERYIGIQRLDYVNKVADTVASSDDDQLLDVDGSRVWASTYVNGLQQLVSINADTLERKVMALPGINTLPRAYARQTRVWLPESIPNRLAVYDTVTGQVSQMDVVVDGQNVTNFKVLGVDATGRHWLETTSVDGDRVAREWVLYDPITKSVVKRSPAVFLSGVGDPIAVSPDGVLWARTTDSVTYKTYAYVLKP